MGHEIIIFDSRFLSIGWIWILFFLSLILRYSVAYLILVAQSVSASRVLSLHHTGWLGAFETGGERGLYDAKIEPNVSFSKIEFLLLIFWYYFSRASVWRLYHGFVGRGEEAERGWRRIAAEDARAIAESAHPQSGCAQLRQHGARYDDWNKRVESECVFGCSNSNWGNERIDWSLISRWYR